MKKSEATAIATNHRIPLDVDFYTLDSGTVHRILAAADERKYRQPKDANGSRARYFHAVMARALKEKTNEFVVQGDYAAGWEDLCTSTTRKEAREDIKAYRENAPGCYRLIVRRVPV